MLEAIAPRDIKRIVIVRVDIISGHAHPELDTDRASAEIRRIPRDLNRHLEDLWEPDRRQSSVDSRFVGYSYMLCGTCDFHKGNQDLARQHPHIDVPVRIEVTLRRMFGAQETVVLAERAHSYQSEVDELVSERTFLGEGAVHGRLAEIENLLQQLDAAMLAEFEAEALSNADRHRVLDDTRRQSLTRSGDDIVKRARKIIQPPHDT